MTNPCLRLNVRSESVRLEDIVCAATSLMNQCVATSMAASPSEKPIIDDRSNRHNVVESTSVQKEAKAKLGSLSQEAEHAITPNAVPTRP